MHPFVRKVWDSLRRGSSNRRRQARLGFEVLEDRCVPTGSGSISGLVYLNLPSNGLPGATIQLTGTPTGGSTIPVHLDAVTDAAGAFNFNGLPDGDYHLTAGAFPGLIGTVTFGSVTASPGVTIDDPVTVAGDASTQNVVIQGGIDPSFITMSMFLNTATGANLPFIGATGTGSGNDAPFVSSAIAAQSLSNTNTTTSIDLAGHFSDPNITDSAVTMNVTANGVAQHINLTLSDTTAPQAVANFFDYVNAGAYDNNFFFRNTNTAADGIDIIQAGGASIIDGSRASVNATSFPTIPDEISALNTNGTLATANTGAANSASGQFFFNTADNPSLDHAPGSGQQGYTVFGKAADAASQAVLDSFSAVPTNNLSGAATIAAAAGATESGNTVTITTTAAHRLLVGQKVAIAGVSVAGYNGAFTVLSVPSATTFTYTNTITGLADSGSGSATGNGFLLNEVPLTGGAATDFPTDASRYLVINSITTTRRDDFLTYSVLSNSNTALVHTDLINEQLKLTYGTGSGSADIVVQATDRFGASTTTTIHVTVANHAPTTGVTLNTLSPNPTATLTATATPADVDGDTVILTYNWTVNGTLVRSNTGSPLLTDSLDLTNVHNLGTGDPIAIVPGDSIVVTVTPNDSTTDGAVASATATVNHPPAATTPTITPASPSNNATLTATTTKSDADGDPVVLTYNWQLNGTLVHSTGPTSSLSDTLDLKTIGTTVHTGDVISVFITPSDGKINGAVATADITIANSAPVVTSVSITPDNALDVMVLTANPVSTDADSDTVTYTYQWLKNNVDIGGATSQTLDVTTLASVGDTFAVRVTPNDGKTDGLSFTSGIVTIATAAPDPITLA